MSVMVFLMIGLAFALLICVAAIQERRIATQEQRVAALEEQIYVRNQGWRK